MSKKLQPPSDQSCRTGIRAASHHSTEEFLGLLCASRDDVRTKSARVEWRHDKWMRKPNTVRMNMNPVSSYRSLSLSLSLSLSFPFSFFILCSFWSPRLPRESSGSTRSAEQLCPALSLCLPALSILGYRLVPIATFERHLPPLIAASGVSCKMNFSVYVPVRPKGQSDL